MALWKPKQRSGNNFVFTEIAGTNKLEELTINGILKDLSYDQKGRLTNDDFTVVSDIEYNYRNLPLSLISNDNDYEYSYNASGERIIKIYPPKPFFWRRRVKDHLGSIRTTIDEYGAVDLFCCCPTYAASFLIYGLKFLQYY
ncbi:MAG: hypothetical protein PVH88_27125 [Ignavibacteria bacterium]|jgi:YD repeat-containing protein